MSIRVLFFGAFTEQIGQNEMLLSDIQSIAQLKQQLESDYPFLREMPYAVALNQQIVTNNESKLNSGDEIAIMPPFAGG